MPKIEEEIPETHESLHLPVALASIIYPDVEDVEPWDPMFGQLCVDVLLSVLVAAAVLVAGLAVVVEFVWADTNPIETVVAITATIAIAMSE